MAMLVLSGCAMFRQPETVQKHEWVEDPTVEKVEREPLDPSLLQPPNGPFTLGPGDWVQIEVIGDPDTRTLAPVGPDGKIYFHVLPGIDVWGLTPAQSGDRVQDALGTFYRNPPQVALYLNEVGSKHVWLLGRFVEPGIYPMNGHLNLLEAITLAGGPAAAPRFAMLNEGGMATFAGGTDEAADLHRSFVIRDGEILSVDFHRLVREGDMSQNIYLQPGDLVYLPTAASQEVHVLGAVAQPRAVSHTRRTTLLTAIANAGGTVEEAHLSQVAIVRGELNNPEIIVVNFRDVVRGAARDIALEPNDIVYVPLTPYRTVTRYLDLILSTFARTVGINAGARAVSREGSATIGVSVGDK